MGTHVTRIRRCEAAKAEPTLEILRNLARSLGVSADVLLFDENERGPDDDLRLPFEAAERLDPDEKRLVRELPDALLLKHQVRQWEAAKG